MFSTGGIIKRINIDNIRRNEKLFPSLNVQGAAKPLDGEDYVGEDQKETVQFISKICSWRINQFKYILSIKEPLNIQLLIELYLVKRNTRRQIVLNGLERKFIFWQEYNALPIYQRWRIEDWTELSLDLWGAEVYICPSLSS